MMVQINIHPEINELNQSSNDSNQSSKQPKTQICTIDSNH